ncbi:DcaP family trimeric outer membrane transporter [Colwellia sp. Bg11-28]|uniref:DcaP family trimeric outer membrane transporter n=1 Tax=Colwellia sp. Bg11-28 TaxID=2058305 RepID=UPI000C332578|nr:DcaP family trimeric outer membrane transporter [Colwellia sp. Bg11-28]PKH88633.1 hypothetical protein CXF79_04460 [Colwellia sp. Bg11-28]
MLNKKNIILSACILAMSGAANAGYEYKISDNDTITFGGYIKADVRYVDGNIAATNYWYGSGTVLSESKSNFGIAVNETRFNTKYVHGDVTGFIEMDFYGDAVSGGGNEIISNSSNPRLRHAFIKYKNILVGQTWTTFQNTSSLAEAADFGGPLVASAFIRQGQVRYTIGGLQIALENPESFGGQSGDDKVPDFIAKYTFKGDWGNISVSGLARQLQTTEGDSESAFGYGIAGRLKTIGKDDFRFQLHAGNVGRYVGVAAATDLVGEEVEESTAIMVAYRHFWTDDIRSSVFYGNITTDLSDRDRSHWGVNIFKNYTKELSFGLELGNFEMAEQDADSDYVQLSTKYVF